MNSNPPGGPTLWLAVAMMLSIGVGCRSKAPLAFPHDKHLALGVACADCHSVGGKSPELDTCKTCHAEAVGAVTPEQVAEILSSARTTRSNFGLAFDHSRHDGVACSDCHDSAGPRMKIPTMEGCMTPCHAASQGYPLSCDKCHSDLDARGRPGSHVPGWRGAHGPEARTDPRTCARCHRQESCSACHRTSKPADHNNQFRLRGHGVLSGMNRERCLACHRSEFCTRCHLESKPIDHTQAFLGSIASHCGGCPLPLSSNRCAACHTQAPHRTAPAWPTDATHVTGASCRTCHIGPGQKLNHPDNGDNCEVCHAR